MLIPKSFSLSNFFSVLDEAKGSYINPDKINEKLAYIRAAQYAFKSLPYPLLLFSSTYYNNRKIWQPDEELLPGKVIYTHSSGDYLIFKPDYDAWDKIDERVTKEKKKKHKSLSEKERRALAFEENTKAKEVREKRFVVWEGLKFSRMQFLDLMEWAEENWQEYKDLPKVYAKKAKKKKKSRKKHRDNYGLNNFYYAATAGYLRAMDPHSTLFTKKSWDKTLKESADSSFEGIGALLSGGGIYDIIVESPLHGSPALRAGLRAGDIIIKVDGDPIEDMSLGEVVSKIRGPKETTVVLHVERPSELRNLDVSIKRGLIKQYSVESELFVDEGSGVKAKKVATKTSPDGVLASEAALRLLPRDLLRGKKIGLVRLKTFLYPRGKQSSSALVLKHYKKLMQASKSHVDALVLDLRGNAGGYLQEAVSVADLFLDAQKTIVSVSQGGDSPKKLLKTGRTPIIQGIPLVILINSGSASASEILASAMMDYNAALILGDRSFGKATVQTVNPLRNLRSMMMKVTTARYYSPLGYTVQVHGVEPDIQVSDEVDPDDQRLSFREEDMWDHLPRLRKPKPDLKRVQWVQELKDLAAKDSLQVEAYIKEHENDSVAPDFMFLRTLPYIHALFAKPKPKK